MFKDHAMNILDNIIYQYYNIYINFIILILNLFNLPSCMYIILLICIIVNNLVF
jgi:hypothetical protein